MSDELPSDLTITLRSLKGAALSTAVATMSDLWQLIETAPKDGTAVLVYSPAGVDKSYASYEGGFPSHIVTGRWRDGEWITPFVTVETFGGSEYTGTWTETKNVSVEPTHWMPLPEPPSA